MPNSSQSVIYGIPTYRFSGADGFDCVVDVAGDLLLGRAAVACGIPPRRCEASGRWAPSQDPWYSLQGRTVKWEVINTGKVL